MAAREPRDPWVFEPGQRIASHRRAAMFDTGDESVVQSWSPGDHGNGKKLA